MNTISKTLGIIGAALLLAVAPAQAISRIAVVPNVVTGGISTTGVVALNRKAPTGGESITLASNQSFVQVPASVTVAAGSRSASFTITTSAVSSKGGASITGTDPSGKSASGMVFVLPIRVIVLSLQPQKVEGGDPSTGTVTLSGAAPTGGELITLLSNEAFVQVPQSVTVAAGSNTATFTVTTSAVTSNGHALILATDPGDNHVGAGLQVTAPIVVKLAGLEVPILPIIGGASANGSVRLNAEAPAGGIVITLSSSETYVQVPASVTVPAGSKEATFAIATSVVTANSSATVTATDPSGNAQTATVDVVPLQLLGVNVMPQRITGGDSAAGNLHLNAEAPTGGVVITLSSSESFVQVPSSVTIPAGSKTATFTVTTSTVTQRSSAVITAMDPSGHSVAITVLVRPANG